MSEQPEAVVPEWDLADRMRKALRHADIGVAEMADYLGVSRRSVSNWINGSVEPSLQTLRLWSLRTGVPLEWVLAGVPAVAWRPLRRAPTCTPLATLVMRAMLASLACLVPYGAPVTHAEAVLAA